MSWSCASHNPDGFQQERLKNSYLMILTKEHLIFLCHYSTAIHTMATPNAAIVLDKRASTTAHELSLPTEITIPVAVRKAKYFPVQKPLKWSFGNHFKFSVPPQHSFLAPQDAFKFVVNCGSLGEENCALAKLSLESAGTRIATELKFKRQVVVNVLFVPTLRDGIIGLPTATFAAHLRTVMDEKPLGYPQALVKQSLTSSKVDFDPYDINLVFHTTTRWDFNLGDEPIDNSATNFECNNN